MKDTYGELSNVQGVECVEREGGSSARCFATTTLEGIGKTRLGIDVTYGDGEFIWEVTP